MERHFSEQEVSEIIRKAADHQARQKPTNPSATTGVSETELKRVAKELGIDMSALQLAMSEVNADELDDTGSLNSIDRILDRTISGEVPVDDLSIVVSEFTPAGGWNNDPKIVGNGMSYLSLVGLASCNVHASNRNGRTSLRIKSNSFLAFLPTFLPAIFLTFITNMIIWEEIRPMLDDGLPAAILLPALYFTVAFFAFKKLVRYSNRKVLELTNRTAAKLSESADHLRGNLTKSGIPLPEVESAEETRLQ